MTTTNFSQLTLNKLTQDQFNTANSTGTLSETEFYLTPEQAVIFTTSGGAAAGTAYDGSAAVTVSYATVGAAASSHTHYYAGSASIGGAANSVKTSLTFNNGGSGAASGTTYNGSTARTISYNTIGAASSGHTHTCSLATDTGTSAITLSHGSKYKLTAGGSSVIFTMPSDTKVTQTSLGSTATTDYYLLASATSSPTSGSAYGAYYTSYVKLRGTGQLTAQTFYAASDKRLKENIVAYTPSKSVLDLPIYTYNYISDESKTQHIGCLAQDLQEICPELVSLDGEYLTINESKIVYLLLDEVKKLKAEVEDLKAKV